MAKSNSVIGSSMGSSGRVVDVVGFVVVVVEDVVLVVGVVVVGFVVVVGCVVADGLLVMVVVDVAVEKGLINSLNWQAFRTQSITNSNNKSLLNTPNFILKLLFYDYFLYTSQVTFG